jgi:hypothetical protein
MTTVDPRTTPIIKPTAVLLAYSGGVRISSGVLPPLSLGV